MKTSTGRFDLDRAVSEWRKSLRRSPGLEEAHVCELEEGLRDEIEDLVGAGLEEEEAFRRAASDTAAPDVLGGEFHKVRTTRRSGRSPWRERRFMPALLANSMKTAWRQIRRHKGYAALNVAGLALGMACVLLILLYVRHELSYDRHHQGADRIYRVAVTSHVKGFGDLASTPRPLAAALEAELPEIEAAVSLQCWGEWLIRTENAAFKEDRVLFADPRLFDVLSFPLVAGDPRRALAEPNVLIISETTAKKYFGNEDPLQKTAVLSRAGQGAAGEVKTLYKITGVFREPPSAAYFRPGLIAALPEEDPSDASAWDHSNGMTFFKMKPGTNARELQTKIQALFDAHRFGAEEAALGQTRALARWEEIRSPIYLQPLTSLHLRSHIAGDLPSNGNILYIAVFSAIAGLILVLACVNFINLSTARAGLRAREVGIRKVAGSTRARLVGQFLTETAVMTLLAFALAMAAAGAALPLFNNLSGLDLSWRALADLGFLSLVLAALALVSLLAGLYPAFVLSSAGPAAVLKGRLRQGSRGRVLRKGLVVFQFTIGLVLMTGALLISRQLRYIREANAGLRQGTGAPRSQRFVSRPAGGRVQAGAPPRAEHPKRLPDRQPARGPEGRRSHGRIPVGRPGGGCPGPDDQPDARR